MEREMTALTAIPLEMEMIPVAADRRMLSFWTPEGYFFLTDATDAEEEDDAAYYEVGETAYEDESLSLYFPDDARFEGMYDVVTLLWPMDETIIDFLAGHLFFDTPLKLARSAGGRHTIQ